MLWKNGKTDQTVPQVSKFTCDRVQPVRLLRCSSEQVRGLDFRYRCRPRLGRVGIINGAYDLRFPPFGVEVPTVNAHCQVTGSHNPDNSGNYYSAMSLHYAERPAIDQLALTAFTVSQEGPGSSVQMKSNPSSVSCWTAS